MALQINFDKEFKYECFEIDAEEIKTVNFPTCYVKVSSIKGGKEKILATVKYFEDNTKTKVINAKEYAFTPTMLCNFIEDTYNYLKTLDEFKDAIDV